MTILLIITGLLLFLVYTATLHKNTVQSFISGAVYKWYKVNNESSSIKPQVAKDFMTSRAFQSTKGVTGILTITWLVICAVNGFWALFLALPVGFIGAVLFIKFTHSRFNTRKAIKAGRVVVASKRQYIGQLSANDIASNTPKYQLSNLDFLLGNEDFVQFTQKLKRAHFNAKESNPHDVF